MTNSRADQNEFPISHLRLQILWTFRARACTPDLRSPLGYNKRNSQDLYIVLTVDFQELGIMTRADDLILPHEHTFPADAVLSQCLAPQIFYVLQS